MELKLKFIFRQKFRIDHVPDLIRFHPPPHHLHHRFGHRLHSLLSRRPHVAAHTHLLVLANLTLEFPDFVARLVLKDVASVIKIWILVEMLEHIPFVDNASSCCVDDSRVIFHILQKEFVNKITIGVAARNVKSDHV